ncbi:MAG: rhodanese-like domain-containing protein [Acidibacillus sp.]|nr:rhodanese-like domain-containing protein [Acidibacillus sp.]
MAVPQWMPIDVKERLKENKNLQIIDVREPYEYNSGHIPGAISIPLGQLQERHSEIDKNSEAVIVCLSGGRSSSACNFLQSAGFKNIYNLMGGMSGWDGDVI